MNPKELEKEMELCLSQITSLTEADRYLDALTKLVYWAIEERQININNELQSVFDLIQYYQAAAKLAAYEEGVQHRLKSSKTT